MSLQKQREPITLAAGESISFIRSLKDFPASQGWVLKYELRGQQVPLEFVSTPQGDSHVLFVDGNVTATWIPGDYQFAGYAELSGTTEQRRQIYLASLTVTPDLETVAGDVVLTTHAQRMLTKLEAVIEGKAGDDILDSEVEGTVIRRMPFDQIYKLRAKYKREREGEIAKENARNGRPTGRLIKPRVNVMFPGGSIGPRDIFGFGGPLET